MMLMMLNSDESWLPMMLNAVNDVGNADNADTADDADVEIVYDIIESVLEGANQGVCLNPSKFLSHSQSWPKYCSRACLSSHHTLLSLTLKIRENKQSRRLMIRKFDFIVKAFFCLIHSCGSTTAQNLSNIQSQCHWPWQQYELKQPNQTFWKLCVNPIWFPIVDTPSISNIHLKCVFWDCYNKSIVV